MTLGRQQQRRDTAANWASNNPTLADGEIGYDTTNKLLKVGDGATAWNTLAAYGQTRVGSTASSGTPSIDAALYGQYNITALAVAMTAVTVTNPTDGAKLTIRIKDNGTARAITLGSSFRALGVTLPTTTVLSKTLYIGCIYNGADSVWDVVATAQQA